MVVSIIGTGFGPNANVNNNKNAMAMIYIIIVVDITCEHRSQLKIRKTSVKEIRDF